MSAEDERELLRRFNETVPQTERAIWADRSAEVLAWSRKNGANWLWNYVNRRLEASLDASADDALVSSSLRTVFDGVHHGLLLVSGNLTCLHANQVMQRALAERAPFAEAEGRIVAGAGRTREVLDDVQALLAGDRSDAGTLHRRIDPGRGDAPGSSRHFLRVDRLETEEDAHGVRPLPIGLIQLWSEGAARGPAPDALRAWFDLTQAEARLASAFAGGRTLAEYAAEEGVSLHTVRKQFAHLREKMAARDQADVLRILLQLTGV